MEDSICIQNQSPTEARALFQLLAIGVAVVSSSCGASQPRVVQPPQSFAAPVGEDAPSPPADRARQLAAKTHDVDRELATEARLETIQRVALARNPEIVESQARVRAARERAPAASRLPDPEFEYQLWAQPIADPVAFDEAQMHMFTLRQAFPAPGSLGAREEAASREAEVISESRRATEQKLLARVRRAYAAYYLADREYRVHLEHVELNQHVLDVARAAYQGGRGTQQDVLRTAVALSRIHKDVVIVDADRRSAKALLNTLMARRVDAPLGPPAALEPTNVDLRLDQIEKVLAARRPEIAAAKSAIRVRESELDAARASARWPNFMVGLSYMYMPMEEEKNNYGVMLSMSLPWLNPRSREEVRVAEANVAAEQSALSSVQNAARFELYDAAQRLKAAQESYAIIERDLLPQAQRSFESAQAGYRGGQGDSLAVLDALRSLIEFRIERERALASLESALASVERAIGGPIPKVSTVERKTK